MMLNELFFSIGYILTDHCRNIPNMKKTIKAFAVNIRDTVAPMIYPYVLHMPLRHWLQRSLTHPHAFLVKLREFNGPSRTHARVGELWRIPDLRRVAGCLKNKRCARAATILNPLA